VDPGPGRAGRDLTVAPSGAAAPAAGAGAPLCLLAPVYNEAENFPSFAAEVERHVPPPFTLLVVYDFDGDTTVPVARALAADRPWIRLVRNDLGPGVAWALRAGFAAAPDGPVLVLMADLSDDLSVVPEMLRMYRSGFRVVCASRYMRGGRQIGGPLAKRWMSRAAGLSLRWLARFPTHDATNNFRLYDAALVREMGIDSRSGFEVALELTAKAFRRGERVGEVPTTWRDRTAGASRFRVLKWLPRYLRWYSYAMIGVPAPPARSGR